MITNEDLKEFLSSPIYLTREEIIEIMDEEIDKGHDMDTDFVDYLVEILIEADERTAKKNSAPLELPNPKIVEMPDVPKEAEDGADTDSEPDDTKIITFKLPSILKKLAVAASFVLVLSSVNFVARAYGIDTIAIIRDFGDRIIEMVAGEKTEYKGITIIKNKESIKYNSILDFLNKEKLNILYPAKLPDNANLLRVNVTDVLKTDRGKNLEYMKISYVTSDSNVGISVFTTSIAENNFLINPSYIKEMICEFECYVLYTDNSFIQCEFIHKNNTYRIRATTKSDIISIISNLKEQDVNEKK